MSQSQLWAHGLQIYFLTEISISQLATEPSKYQSYLFWLSTIDMPLPSIGGGRFFPHKGRPYIRFMLKGHSNRPFFHIVLTSENIPVETHPVEQLGTYDPMPNTANQKLVSLNVERTKYWMGEGAVFSKNVAKLLGMVGVLPIHPESYMDGWRWRYKAAEDEAKAKAEKAESEGTSQPPSSSSS